MCDCRRKSRESDEKKRLSNRLSRINGQINGIQRMVDNHKRTLRYTGLPYILRDGDLTL